MLMRNIPAYVLMRENIPDICINLDENMVSS